MANLLNTEKLSLLLKSKRGSRGLRTVANEIGGISASTLSRIEQGNLPDVDTFLRICQWMEVSPEEFAKDETIEYGPVNTKDLILSHLRADRTLAPQTIAALSEMINLAYEKH